VTKLFVVDGTFELFRCFHGAPRYTDPTGKEVGAVRGLLWTLVKLLRRPDLTHVAFAMDRMAAPRAGDPSAVLRSQNALAMEVVRALGIPLWPMVRYQADDALATAAARYVDDVDQVVLCTSDKDCMQCVRDDRVVLLDRIRKRLTDETAMRERFGVPPSSWPDYLALVGDPSDGLPGVPGWGARSTAIVLARYGNLEQIPVDAADWDVRVRGAPRLSGSLRERWHEAVLMRDLSILRTDMPLPQGIDDLSWSSQTPELALLADRVGAGEALHKLPR